MGHGNHIPAYSFAGALSGLWAPVLVLTHTAGTLGLVAGVQARAREIQAAGIDSASSAGGVVSLRRTRGRRGRLSCRHAGEEGRIPMPEREWMAWVSMKGAEAPIAVEAGGPVRVWRAEMARRRRKSVAEARHCLGQTAELLAISRQSRVHRTGEAAARRRGWVVRQGRMMHNRLEAGIGVVPGQEDIDVRSGESCFRCGVQLGMQHALCSRDLCRQALARWACPWSTAAHPCEEADQAIPHRR